MSLNCQPEIPAVKGLEDGQMTVGRHLLLHCQGDTGSLNTSSALLKSEKPVRLFKLVSDGGGVTLDMTFYSAGDHALSSLVLTDGVNELTLDGNPVKVQSVLKAPESGKPQEPFGSILPVPIPVPSLYVVGIVAFFLLVFGYGFYRVKRLSFYNRLKQGLKKYSSPVSPEAQFYRAIRQTEKLGYPLEQVERSFRLYMLRAYQLPMFDLPDERLLRYFKRNFPKLKETRTGLSRLLGEFEELKKNPAAKNADDRADFIKKLYRFVDHNKGLSV